MKTRPNEFKNKQDLNKIQKTKLEKLKNYTKELKKKYNVKCTVNFD